MYTFCHNLRVQCLSIVIVQIYPDGDVSMDVGAGDLPQPGLRTGEAEPSPVPVVLLNNVSPSEGDVAVVSVPPEEQYILSIDIGTTNIRGHVYSKSASLKGSISKQVLHVNSHSSNT